MKFLEIAGSFKKGSNWDNIRDIPIPGSIQHDMTNLPIPGISDNTYDGVYCEHFIEHITQEQGISFLKEMYRIMQPNAVIRIVWPSMDCVDRLRTTPTENDIKFAELYNKHIIERENVFNNPYYQIYGAKSYFDSLSILEKTAFRLLHQEGEHKYLWYNKELKECMSDLGFKNVQNQPYRVSGLLQFNNIDNPQEMRPLHSTVIEATK